MYSTSSFLSPTYIFWFSECIQLASGYKMLHFKGDTELQVTEQFLTFPDS